MTPDELNGIVGEFQDDPEFWSTLGIDPPPPPPGVPGVPGAPGAPGAPGEPGAALPPPPVFVPPPEKLESIRGDDKDSKKSAIFELAGQDGGLSGLITTLTPDELNSIVGEFQDDPEFWSTLGIDPPPPPSPDEEITVVGSNDPLTDGGVV